MCLKWHTLTTWFSNTCYPIPQVKSEWHWM